MLPCGAPERLIIFSLNELSLFSVAKLRTFPGTTNKKSMNFQCIFEDIISTVSSTNIVELTYP